MNNMLDERVPEMYYDFEVDKIFMDMQAVGIRYLETNGGFKSEFVYDEAEIADVREEINNLESISNVLKNCLRINQKIQLYNNVKYSELKWYIQDRDIKDKIVNLVYSAHLLIEEIDKYIEVMLESNRIKIKIYSELLENELYDLEIVLRRGGLRYVEEWFENRVIILANLLYYAKVEMYVNELNKEEWDFIKDRFYNLFQFISDDMLHRIDILCNAINEILTDEAVFENPIDDEWRYLFVELNPILTENYDNRYFNAYKKLCLYSHNCMYMCTINNRTMRSVKTVMSNIDSIINKAGITRWKKEEYNLDNCKGACFAIAKVSYCLKGVPDDLFFIISGLRDNKDICDMLKMKYSEELIKSIQKTKVLQLIKNNNRHAKMLYANENICSYRYKKGKYILRNAIEDYRNAKPEYESVIKGEIAKNFSCCERKLFANIIGRSKCKVNSIEIYVKYAPCDDCKNAIQYIKKLLRIKVKNYYSD